MNSKVWFVAASLCTSLCANLSRADDTELYVSGGSIITSRPQVLIIFDNSGSMKTEEALTPAPYDPSHDYTGYGGDRIYYIKGASSTSNYPNPRNGSERRYIQKTQNGCADTQRPHPENSAYSVLEYGGIYTNNFRSFQYNKKRKNGKYWTKVPDSISDSIRSSIIIDCKADLDNADPTNASSHPNSGLRDSGFAQNSNKREPYDGSVSSDSASELEAAAEASLSETGFGSNDTVTLFTENYLAYFHNSATFTETRLNIAKNTINDLVISTAGVDFGLAVFNYDTAGRVVYGIREMTDSNQAALINTVNSLSAETWTPLCETLFEAYRYFGGGKVHKGTSDPYRTPRYDETIIENGSYQSPMIACQPQAYVVLITDGKPTEDNSFDNLIKSELGLTDADKVDGNLLAGVADKMYTRDLSDSLAGQQRVVTYTVGFSDGASDAERLLKETAFRGGGEYYPAADAQALQGALQEIFSHILAVNASFTSPSIAANSFDRTRTLDSVYYAMFLPSDRPRWLGNLKKLKINSDGEVIDQKGVVAIDNNGDIADDACTFWTSTSTCALASSGGDGNEVSVGGVLAALQSQSTRRVLTSPASGSDLVALTQSSLEAAVGGQSELMASIGITDAGLIPDYVRWLQGIDVDDDDDDLSSSDMRFDLFGDPLHSKPLAINYGDASSVRLLVGTNYGMLHMFEDKGDSVSESWAWYLPEFVDSVKELRDNNQTGGHTVYGVDGSPVLYVTDADLDGEIDANTDKVWAFFGLRRGGRSYYGLDITNPDRPKLMWQKGADDLGFAELGQSWADPTVTTIPGNDGKPVIVVGAGYDLNKDRTTVGSADGMGRGILVLDAASGNLVHRFVAGVTNSNTTTLLDTEDSIPNQVAVFDSDGDGVSDRFYATDTGANVWRIDMPSDDRDSWSVIKFAELGGDNTTSDRRFHAAVSVAQTSFALRQELTVTNPDGSTSEIVTNSEVPYDAVTIGSGNRAHPNAIGTQNHLFALQDRYILTQTFGTDDNPAPEPIRLTDLYDIGDDPFGNASDAEDQLEAELALGSKQGWYYPLAASEKSLADPIIIAGSVFFTTFTPGNDQQEDACVSAGNGHLYEFTLQEGIRIRSVGLGARLPDTPQIVVPPPPDGDAGDWDPTLHLIGVGPGDDRTGTIETDQQMVPKRVYYHSGN